MEAENRKVLSLGQMVYSLVQFLCVVAGISMVSQSVAFACGGYGASKDSCSKQCTVKLSFYGDDRRLPQYSVLQDDRQVMLISAKDAADLATQFQHLVDAGICEK